MSDTRRARQHDEILGLLLTGDVGRASALAAEHLDEFPTDQVIGRLLSTYCRNAPE